MNAHPDPHACAVDFAKTRCPACRREIANRAAQHELTILTAEASDVTVREAFVYIFEHLDAAVCRDALRAVQS